MEGKKKSNFSRIALEGINDEDGYLKAPSETRKVLRKEKKILRKMISFFFMFVFTLKNIKENQNFIYF